MAYGLLGLLLKLRRGAEKREQDSKEQPLSSAYSAAFSPFLGAFCLHLYI